MPRLGLGVYKVGNEAVVDPVRWALEAGYRSIDTAAFYGNEGGVGLALQEAGQDRSQVFLTSKVWNSEQGYSQTLAAFDRSLDRLGLDYLDLYLIHWPVPGRFQETWRACRESIGISGCGPLGLAIFRSIIWRSLSRLRR
jgi:diketogulonate reductase-like aldo/keto reductase